jgi:hypothetical protein
MTGIDNRITNARVIPNPFDRFVSPITVEPHPEALEGEVRPRPALSFETAASRLPQAEADERIIRIPYHWFARA